MLIVANWKMNISSAEAIHLAKAINEIPIPGASTIILCPSFPHIKQVADIIFGQPNIFLGAQDCSAYSAGAYTGEVSAAMLAELGCKYVIIGHSERRRLHNETADIIQQKIIQAQKHGLKPIVCIGESQITTDVQAEVKQQILDIIPAISADFNIAYEPSWAIGSNKLPSVQWVSDIISIIKKEIGNYAPVLYGGSVNADNISNFAQCPLDGFLLGGASLNAKNLQHIIKNLSFGINKKYFIL